MDMQQMGPGGMDQMGAMQNMAPQEGMPQAGPPPQDEAMVNPSYEDGDSPDQEQFENLMDYALSEANLAKKFKNKKLDDGTLVLEKMAHEVYQGYLDDEESRRPWMEKNEEWLKLSLLIRENKSYPWPNASNVKYPLIATAAMQFSARAYPALVPSDGKVVKASVAINDPQDILGQQARRVAEHMSYQILCKIPNWEEDMDKLLMTMAVSGIAFKKTYHSGIDGVNHSCLVYPENFCVNYWAKSIEKAYRKTEILHYVDNDIYGKVHDDEVFLDIDYGTPEDVDNDDQKQPIGSDVNPPAIDKSTPHVFYAIHTWWDLDDDGYEEPYIITIHKGTKKVVRIVARWDMDGVKKNDKDQIISITPVEYFTDFPFIPNPDGSIYACGFGMLMAPLNETINTLINQLVDAGTLSNLQGGFMSKNLRIKKGNIQLIPGQWLTVNASPTDMKDGFFPTPVREPSKVLFELMNLLITSGNQLASIAEIFVGKMPGQNTPATTTQETIQQGMAVFTAVYKRIYRSLAKEFDKLFRLNRITPDITREESKVAGIPLEVSDYQGTQHLIIPGADPTGDSNTVRMQKLQQVGGMIQMGTINPMELTKRMLEANEIPNWQQLLAQPEPAAPDPKLQTEQLKQQGLQQKAQLDSQAKQQDMQLKERSAELEAMGKLMELQFKKQQQAIDDQNAQRDAKLDMVLKLFNQQHEQKMGNIKEEQAAISAAQSINHADQMHRQSMIQGDNEHKQKMQQARKELAMKPKQKAK